MSSQDENEGQNSSQDTNGNKLDFIKAEFFYCFIWIDVAAAGVDAQENNALDNQSKNNGFSKHLFYYSQFDLVPTAAVNNNPGKIIFN